MTEYLFFSFQIRVVFIFTRYNLHLVRDCVERTRKTKDTSLSLPSCKMVDKIKMTKEQIAISSSFFTKGATSIRKDTWNTDNTAFSFIRLLHYYPSVGIQSWPSFDCLSVFPFMNFSFVILNLSEGRYSGHILSNASLL